MILYSIKNLISTSLIKIAEEIAPDEFHLKLSSSVFPPTLRLLVYTDLSISNKHNNSKFTK